MTRDELRASLIAWKRVNDDIASAIDALSVTHADVDHWVSSGFCAARLADQLRVLADTPAHKLRGERFTDEVKVTNAEARVKEFEAKLAAAESRLEKARRWSEVNDGAPSLSGCCPSMSELEDILGKADTNSDP